MTRRSTLPPPRLREAWQRKFQGLMPFRVREILLVSSDYDAFVLEEDGPLTERLFSGFSELSLSSAPRITHVTTGAHALELLAQQRFDLVITVPRVEDTDASALSAQIKAQHPGVAIVLLLFDEAEVRTFQGGTIPETADLTILWGGSARTLLAAIKLVEDRRNVEHDVRRAGIPIILLVEERIRSYSAFLSLFYPELMSQSQSLIQEGFNDLQRLMRMRARPKVLLVEDWEEAERCLDAHGERMMAIFTGTRFRRAGRQDDGAGVALAELVKERLPDVPVLFLSAEDGAEEQAAAMGLWSVPKSSPAFAASIRGFLRDVLGFGPFVFRLPDGTEVARAHNVYEMEELLTRVPIESIERHAKRHDFSVWLRARSMYEVAAELHPRMVGDFETLEQLRQYLAEALQRARETHQEGSISDSVAPSSEVENVFTRVGRGSMGGKARGIAYVSSMLVRYGLSHHFDGLQIRIPRSIAIGTDTFDRFMEANPGLANERDADLERWLRADFDQEVGESLSAICRTLHGPLAVRSSSVQEDSRFRPFAGVYATYMLPNNHPHPYVRHRELLKAIKAVYASGYTRDATSHAPGAPRSLEDEPMAVLIQQVVGERHGRLFYPLISGVAQSRNHYPLGPQRREDGVAMLALGLGETVVRGGNALRFSPRSPGVLPQFATARAQMQRSQSEFHAIDLKESEVDFTGGHTASLVLCDLEVAEKHGTLQAVGSVYSDEEDVIRDTLDGPGTRIVTFNDILRHDRLPLAGALSMLLELLREGMGTDVEIEIAVGSAGSEDHVPALHVLQLRPMPPYDTALGVSLDDAPRDRVLLETRCSLGHGQVTDLRDVVYVRRSDIDATEADAAASEIRELTRPLHRARVPYLLVGPGRWGTSDPALGIPVQWQDIDGARAIVETPLAGRPVEPPQGSHFFHNVTARHMGYLTLGAGAEEQAFLDRDWLDRQPAAQETPLVRHLRLPSPLLLQMDGVEGRALVLKPEV